MSTEENKGVVRRWFEELNKGNLDAADEMYAATYVLHDPSFPPDLPPGPEGVKQFVRTVIDAVPDLKVTVEHMIAEGDMVAISGTLSGTHQGELAGIAGTGKPLNIILMSMIRIADGKFAEEWELSDTLSMMQQIGAIPTPDQPG